MIRWKRYSYKEIKKKWDTFQNMRQKNHGGHSDTEKWHITCLERESLIDNLISRLDEEMTRNFEESIGK